MRRMRLWVVMFAIAVLAVFLPTGDGLRRRAQRLNALALEYGREASRLENEWMKADARPPGEPDNLMEETHWHDAVADAYRRAAARPWFPFDPVPESITCECGYHASARARTVE